MLKPQGLYRSTRALVLSLAALAFVAPASCSSTPAVPSETVGSTAQAETVDTFGLGDGRSGAGHITAANTVVNTYAGITAVNAAATTVTIGTPQGLHATGPTPPFAAGDLLFVWRTTGISLTSGSSGKQDPINLASDVGFFEFGRVRSVAGSVLTLTNPLSSATRYATYSQVVRIPEYTTVDIDAGASVVPYAWDGTAGGIVVFLASQTVTNQGTIAADGAGFRGGQVENATATFTGCTQLDGSDEAAVCGGAHKGEGVSPNAYSLPATPAGSAPAMTYGRGDYANGAGGGDASNAGGGGGGGFGKGGYGGVTADAQRQEGGFGGAPLAYDPTSANYVAFGGGGGAGDESHGTGTSGAPGGGVVYVRASTFAGTGAYSASGGSVTATAGTDGSGGGGGGGAVYLFSTDKLDCGSIAANGGTGGSGGSEPDGPGGGGGGGLVYVQASSTNCTPTVSFGPNGTSDNPTINGQADGASQGTDGSIVPNGGVAYGGGVCTADQVAMNLCGGCALDTDCPTGQVCDTTKNTCNDCNATEQGSCTGTKSACKDDKCVACNGDYNSGSTAPCLSAALPECVTSGLAKGTCGECKSAADCTTATAPACALSSNTCLACDGDQGMNVNAACPKTSAPYCETDGSCGKCTQDSDCTGNHAGPRCDVPSGACGDFCVKDSDCDVGQWCDDLGQGTPVCQAKVANGKGVPGGTCTTSLGERACISGACDVKDNECGLGNGEACKPSGAAVSTCRSGVCPSSGPNADTCQPCDADDQCSGETPACSPTSNTCVSCTATNAKACKGDSPVCDVAAASCVACNGDHGTKVTAACPSATSPLCYAVGACGTCTGNSDCGGQGHLGPICTESTGTCGTNCAHANDCLTGQWCQEKGADDGACVAQIADGQPLPTTPSSLSKCTPDVAQEVCASGTCDVADNTCGTKPDAGPTKTDAGVDAGKLGPPGSTLEGGALNCSVRGDVGRESPYDARFAVLGLALAGVFVARRRAAKAAPHS